jgi:DNA helicase-2/ATP-dependent DNA helicase PcrA
MTSSAQQSAHRTQWLDQLNVPQRNAVTHGDGPLLVVAGAGSGKTRTLACRVAWLIAQGVKPQRILLLTFTRRASQEMLKRAASAAASSVSVTDKVWGGTFHAIANRLLRIYHKQAGLSADFTIMDQADAEDTLDIIRHQKGFSEQKSRFPRKSTCLAIYSRKMNSTISLELVLKKNFPWCERWREELTVLFREYVERKQRQSILDYDDLLMYWYFLLENDELARDIGNRFDHILVDEYQDTNRVQAGILARMRLTHKNIMVVGDDAQSIYSFRSATIRNMLDFPQQFPGATVITLEQNYRSTPSILAASNRLIAASRERYSKELFTTRDSGDVPQIFAAKDEDSEAEIVIAKVLEHYEQGIPLREQAVLFRAAHHSNALELELVRREIPFHKYGGLRFLEAAHIKDLICLLRIMENPQDETAWFRILKLLKGVGPATAARIYDHVRGHGFVASKVGGAPCVKAAASDLVRMAKLFEDLEAAAQAMPSAQIERINAFYIPLLRENYDNADARVNDVEQMAHLAQKYPSRKKFLEELVLDPPSSTSDLAGDGNKDEDYLVLSTIHSAKGCEWDAVYLIHAADGCLPSDLATGDEAEIEEERRLAYVAMTRAKNFLYVCWPLRFYHHPAGFSDFHTYSQRSRFFTAEVVAQMHEVIAPGQQEVGDSPSTQPGGGDIGGRLRKMWE